MGMRIGSIMLVLASCLSPAPLPAKSGDGLAEGQASPDWRDLPGTDGRTHSLSDYDAAVLVVVFTCNECPVAIAYEHRLVALARDYARQSIQLIAIHVNRSESLEEMQVRAKERGLPYPYLRDETHEWAKAFGARVTPQAFVFNQDRKLVYQGAIDDNYVSEERVKHHYVREAIDALLAGQTPPVPTTRPVGCAIRWR